MKFVIDFAECVLICLIHYVNVKWCQSAEYIDVFLDEAVKQYGSVQAYIRERLGITDK